MQIFIDGIEQTIDSEGLNTFKDLIDYIDREVVKPPLVVTRVILNEEELDEGQEIGLGGFPITEVVSLALHTEDQTQLAYEALMDAQIYLPQLAEILEKAAKTIREGNINEGLQSASEALEFVSAFGDVLNGIRGAFQVDFSLVQIDDITLLDKLLDLNRNAGAVLKAIQDEEWTLFADLIEYEISPLLFEWMAVIPELVRMLPAQGEAGVDEPE
jgi:hypothetical protein